MQSEHEAVSDPHAREAVRKALRRLVPFLALMFVLAFLDRVNVGFAKDELEVDVGIGAAAYGLGAGIFFVGYAFFEVPSNLIMHRVGARRWLSRIMVSWGLIAAAMYLVQGELSFYLLRFLLGVAEAGFFPGVILYLTYWFPDRYRSTATGLMYWGLPLAYILGAPSSGLLMEMDGIAALAGWQWMFLVQGLAASAVGVWAWFFLDDRPQDAAWLTPAERIALQEQLDREAATRPAGHTASVGSVLTQPIVLYFSLIYFCIQLSLYGVTFWLPSTVEDIGGLDSWQVGLISALPWMCALAGLFLVGRAADRSGRYRQYGAACMTAAAAGIALSAALSPVPAIAALCLAAFGFIAVLPVFWALPTRYFTGLAAAGGIALVNSVGNVGGFLAPYFLGLVEESTGSVQRGMYVLAGTTLLGAILIAMTRRRPADRLR
ncbi:MFS transporter [Jiangella asiatica]|uniref:MFS transporter n=1 Tax=Jiangella asiatica TaxID=2530372 RepID=A0A4R5DHM2_9ACTN|nr:MFS transporter [Jiangella asiatica]TDE11420.1 MFS transporter [Jiangella asiatica]